MVEPVSGVCYTARWVRTQQTMVVIRPHHVVGFSGEGNCTGSNSAPAPRIIFHVIWLEMHWMADGGSDLGSFLLVLDVACPTLLIAVDDRQFKSTVNL
ncbi:hypothetical protein BHE74_00015782 [Ensete ventricosum]|nr:hypothetical protein GW17_00010301 [Ensete ventricosum]RWW76147.1 hypothetical protein BHE74_00015782 [Ensete ventricosum]RZR90516.1 hypothetical protein BHM03_00018408 [Ensete ventricosum]